MKEKDFKQIITSFDQYSQNKKTIDNSSSKLIENINKSTNIKIDEYKYSSWYLFQVYDEDDLVSVFINPKTISFIKDEYKNKYILNNLENRLIELDFNSIERTNNQLNFNKDGISYSLYIKEYQDVLNLINKINDLGSKYSLLINTFKIIKELINQDAIKLIDPIILFSLFSNAFKNYELQDNKYYCYLELLIKAIDELINNRKYVIEYFNNEILVYDLLNETIITEIKKLRKSLSKAISTEEDELKFDSSKEIVIDVNPIKENNAFMWHYKVINKDLENSGGIYQNTVEEYQTAILKGIFKGLKRIVDSPNLINKKIVLKCEYEGILTEKMLSNDENKSRMKTIKQLIETNNLKVTELK